MNRAHRRKITVFAGSAMLCCFVLGIDGTAAFARAASASALADIAPEPDAKIRFAAHKDFDRLVIVMPDQANATSRQDGSTLTLTFSGVGHLTGDSVVGRRMLALSSSSGQASVRLAAKTKARVWRLGARLIVDVLDVPLPQQSPPRLSGFAVAVDSRRAAQIARTAISQQATTQVATVSVPTPSASLPPRAPSPLPPKLPDLQLPPSLAGAASALPVSGGPGPATIHDPIAGGVRPVSDSTSNMASGAASVLPLRNVGLPGPAILLPFSRDVGAAAFLRGGDGYIVIDVSQPLDLSALKDDPTFGGTTEQLMPDGMLLRIRMNSGTSLHLVRREEGWAAVLQTSTSVMPLRPINGHVNKGVVTLDADAPGHVIVVDDELLGGRLLVGTQRSDGQHVVGPHISAEATLLPTIQGVVVQPVSDRLVFRTKREGFELASAGSSALAITWPEQPSGAWPDGRVMTRIFDFPNLPFDALHRMLGQALEDAAAVPKLARHAARIRVVQAMLAQGMDVEAAAVLRAANADDPAHSDQPREEGLGAIAAWLSAKAGGASAPRLDFDAGRLGDSDEAALWRALLQPAHSDIAQQATVVATVWPLMSSYPPALRRFMLPSASSVLAAGGQQKALAALLTTFKDSSLDLARADYLRSLGRIDESLAQLDQVATRSDRLARAEALEQATDIRLTSHRLDTAAAAEALDHQIYAWRGGDRELNLRQRVATLRAEAGAWRPALEMLRETEGIFPQAAAEIHELETKIVTDLLKNDHGAKLNAFDLIALADDASNLLSADVQSNVAPVLVDKLLALDLPDRAEPILRHLFAESADRSKKAELGVRLAGLMADKDDANSALAVLAASQDTDLEPSIVARRRLLQARLLAQTDRSAEALAILADQHSPEASDLAATILEKRHDWAAAAATLKSLVEGSKFGALADAAQRSTVIRLAGDESQAGDLEGLRGLRAAYAARFHSGQGSELFSVLTADPVRISGDLSRSASEVTTMRSLPALLSRPRRS